MDGNKGIKIDNLMDSYYLIMMKNGKTYKRKFKISIIYLNNFIFYIYFILKYIYKYMGIGIGLSPFYKINI